MHAAVTHVGHVVFALTTGGAAGLIMRKRARPAAVGGVRADDK